MSYGLKRWALGNFFGVSVGIAVMLFSHGHQEGWLFAGLAIALFFADFVVQEREQR